jgi:hypothetical protein
MVEAYSRSLTNAILLWYVLGMTNDPFAKGQKIRIRAGHAGAAFQEGEEFTVAAVDGLMLQLREPMVRYQQNCWWRAERFELVPAAGEQCAACGAPAEPRDCIVLTDEPCKLCAACWRRSVAANRAAIEARRFVTPQPEQPEAPPCFRTDCIPDRFYDGRVESVLINPTRAQRVKAGVEADPYLNRHAGTYLETESEQRANTDLLPRNQAARARNIAAARAELDREVTGPRFPAEGRSERALPRSNGR